MNYIKKIRSLVGRELLILCSCGCLIFNDKGQVLLQHRNDDNLWGNPGGTMKLSETIYDTIIREIKKETNLDIKKENLKIASFYLLFFITY